MASWGIALVEYWLAVPANRIGYGTYSGAELKAMQEVISITIFVGFSRAGARRKADHQHRPRLRA